MTAQEKVQALIKFIEDDINEDNRWSNACAYCTCDPSELIVTFANRTKASQHKHYPMLVNKVEELGGIIKSTHPGTYETLVKF